MNSTASARTHLVEANKHLSAAKFLLRNHLVRHDYVDAAAGIVEQAQKLVAATEGDLTPLTAEDRKARVR